MKMKKEKKKIIMMRQRNKVQRIQIGRRERQKRIFKITKFKIRNFKIKELLIKELQIRELEEKGLVMILKITKNMIKVPSILIDL